MTDSTLEATSFNQTAADWWRPPPSFDPSEAPPWLADTSTIDRFQEDGAVLLRGVFDDWVEPLRAGLERNLRAPQEFAFPCESAPAGEPGRFFDSYCNWLLIPEYLDHVTNSCAASMAGQLSLDVLNGNPIPIFTCALLHLQWRGKHILCPL